MVGKFKSINKMSEDEINDELADLDEDNVEDKDRIKDLESELSLRGSNGKSVSKPHKKSIRGISTRNQSYLDKLTNNVQKLLEADDAAYTIFGLDVADKIQIVLKWIEGEKATTKQVIIDIMDNSNSLKQSKDLHWIMMHLEKWGD